MKTAITIVTHPPIAEQDKHPYDPGFVEKVLQGDKDFENGNFEINKTQDIWKQSIAPRS
jgi:hypothetical protein